jgi:predicted metal-binding membrane protein
VTARLLLEGALRRDRILVISSLVSIIALAWSYLLLGAGMSMHDDMGMPGMPMSQPHVMWTPAYTSLVLTMWAVMMAAMMLPSAAPMILLYGTVSRRRQATASPSAGAGVFALGYVAVWAVFCVVALVLQVALDQAALLSPAMTLNSRWLAGSVLVAAGLYQWTPLKHACLRRCRSPLDFLMTEWREGWRGALMMGIRHGTYCVGCCWMTMLLLFIGGIMNMAWIAGIAAFVLVEKLAPAGHWIGRVAGVALVVWGATTVLV